MPVARLVRWRHPPPSLGEASCDSSGLQGLLQVQHAADQNGAALRLTHVQGQLHRVLRLTHLEAAFDIAPAATT
ncbi:STAS domain-containing protein [Nonomuraea dietziae]|uniref:STAS domain-containing protein n=1 Tax=Nonomuraea dietziae TaxID=65515 RepID=UPI00341B47FF